MKANVWPLVVVLLVAPAALAGDAADAASKKGTDLINAGQPRAALPYLDEAIRLEPKEAWHYLRRGVALCDMREFTRAMEDVDQGIALDPKIPQLWFNRGNLCNRVGRYKQAVAHHKKALTVSPPDWLEKRIRAAIVNNESAHEEVLKGTLAAPEGDVAKLAREANLDKDPMAFWRRNGKVTKLDMQRTETIGDRERTRYSSVECIVIHMPMGRGKWDPLPVYIPLERGEILKQTVPLSCQPKVAILGSPDPLGHRSYHVKLYLEWLYLKSGR